MSPAVWTSLVRAGITRVKPTRRGSRAGRLKRRAIATLLSNSRQPSVQMGYSGFLEHNVNKVTGNLHSEVSELNIHSDTSRRTSNCIVVERGPLLPTQKDRSPALTLCHANVRAVHMRTGRGTRGAAARPPPPPPNLRRLRFFEQQEKFGQSQFLKTFPCFFY